jgi:hypothetical protein
MTKRERARARAAKKKYRKKNGHEDEPVEVVEYRVFETILEK